MIYNSYSNARTHIPQELAGSSLRCQAGQMKSSLWEATPAPLRRQACTPVQIIYIYYMSLPSYLYQRLLCTESRARLPLSARWLTREEITESDYDDVTADAMMVCVLKR